MSSETSEGRDTGCKCISFRKDEKQNKDGRDRTLLGTASCDKSIFVKRFRVLLFILKFPTETVVFGCAQREALGFLEFRISLLEACNSRSH